MCINTVRWLSSTVSRHYANTGYTSFTITGYLTIFDKVAMKLAYWHICALILQL